MVSRIGFSVLTGVSFALIGIISGYILISLKSNISLIPIAVGGFIIGLLFGYYANPEDWRK
jgi:CHASE2 domain-containing sensor protein